MRRMGRERHRVFVKSGVTAETTEDLLQRHFSTFGTVTDVYIPRSLPGPSPKGFAYVSFETDAAVQEAVKEAVHEIEGKHYPVGRAEPRPADRNTWHHQDRSTMPVAEPLLPFPPPRYSRSMSPRGGLLPNPNPHSGGPGRLDMRSSFAHSPRIPLDAGGPNLRDLPPPYGSSRPSLPFTDSFGVDGRIGVSGRVPLDILPAGEQVSRSPRLFVGRLPDALVERHIRQHFQKFGVVEDVYFPRERHTGQRRGFCFVRFDSSRAAHFAAAQSPRLIMGYEVGEIKVANERADDFGSNEEQQAAVEVGLDADRLMGGYGPERGMGRGLERGGGFVPEMGYGPIRAHVVAEQRGGGYGPELGFIRPEMMPSGGLKLDPTPYHDLGRDFPKEFARDFPRDFPRELPPEFTPTREIPPRDFPRDTPLLPRGFDPRPSFRFRPY